MLQRLSQHDLESMKNDLQVSKVMASLRWSLRKDWLFVKVVSGIMPPWCMRRRPNATLGEFRYETANEALGLLWREGLGCHLEVDLVHQGSLAT